MTSDTPNTVLQDLAIYAKVGTNAVMRALCLDAHKELTTANETIARLERKNFELLNCWKINEQFLKDQLATKEAELLACRADKVDAVRYRAARKMPLVMDHSRIAPLRPEKFDVLIDAAIKAGAQS